MLIFGNILIFLDFANWFCDSRVSFYLELPAGDRDLQEISCKRYYCFYNWTNSFHLILSYLFQIWKFEFSIKHDFPKILFSKAVYIKINLYFLSTWEFPAGNARTPVGKITPCATACPNRQIYTDFAKFKHNFSSSLFLAAMSSSSSDNVTKSRPFVRSSVPGLSLILSLKA